MMLLNLCADAPIAPSTEGFTLISIRPERLPDDAIQIYDCTQTRQAGSQSVSQPSGNQRREDQSDRVRKRRKPVPRPTGGGRVIIHLVSPWCSVPKEWIRGGSLR